MRRKLSILNRKLHTFMSYFVHEGGGYEQAYPLNRTAQDLAAVADKPSIIIASLPNSGAQYISSVLAGMLDYMLGRPLWVGEFPKCVVKSWMCREFAEGGLIADGPLQLDSFNLRQLREHGLTKIVLHVRDPRAATYNRMRSPPPNLDLMSKLKSTKRPFLSLKNDERLDFFIQEFFMDSLDWLNTWVEFLEAGYDKLEILVTTHEKLVKNEEHVFRSIAEFHGIATEMIQSNGKSHADFLPDGHPTDQWREAINPGQLERMARMMSPRLFERFGWTP